MYWSENVEIDCNQVEHVLNKWINKCEENSQQKLIPKNGTQFSCWVSAMKNTFSVVYFLFSIFYPGFAENLGNSSSTSGSSSTSSNNNSTSTLVKSNGVETRTAIPILLPVNQSFQFKLNDLTRILEDDNIKDRYIVIVSVTGEFGTGKSLLLNFFRRYLDAQVITSKTVCFIRFCQCAWLHFWIWHSPYLSALDLTTANSREKNWKPKILRNLFFQKNSTKPRMYQVGLKMIIVLSGTLVKMQNGLEFQCGLRFSCMISKTVIK